MKKRVLVFLMAILMVALMMTACGTSTTSPETSAAQSVEPSDQATAVVSNDVSTEQSESTIAGMTIGVTCKDLTIPAYASIANYLETACKENGVNISVVSANADPAKQVSQIENFVQSKVDIIIVMEPVDPAGIADATKAAVAAGIPVIGYGFHIDGNTSELICANYDIGYQTGQECVKWMQEKYDGKGKVALLHLTLNSQPCLDRYNGAKDAIKELAPDIEIVTEQPAQTVEEGMEAAENILQANPDVVAFMSSSGGGAVGANEAIKAAGKNDGTMAVFGCDTTTDVLSILVNGNEPLISTICVGSDSYMANKLFEISSLILGGQDYEEHYDAETELVDINNVNDFIEKENITL